MIKLPENPCKGCGIEYECDREEIK